MKIQVLFFSIITLMLASCESIDNTQHGKAPEGVADIQISPSRIGCGQPFTATATVPTGGENISSVEYSWESGPTISPNDVKEGKISSKMIASTKAGTHKLTFKSRYLFVGPDLEGNIYKDLASTKEYEVVACDVETSFWGDSMDEVKRVRPDLVKKDDKTYVGTYPNIFLLNWDASLSYHFTDGKLGSVLQYQELEYPKIGFLARQYFVYHRNLEKLLNVKLVKEAIFKDGVEIKPYDSSNTTPEYLEEIDQILSEEKAEIISILKGEKTDVELKTAFVSEGSFFLQAKFTPTN